MGKKKRASWWRRLPWYVVCLVGFLIMLVGLPLTLLHTLGRIIADVSLDKLEEAE